MDVQNQDVTRDRRRLRAGRVLLFTLALIGLALELPMNASAGDPHFAGLGCDEAGNNTTGLMCHIHLLYEEYEVPATLPDELPCHYEGGIHFHCDPPE